MLLDDKVAVIYGAGGAIGGAVARTFAREGSTSGFGVACAAIEGLSRTLADVANTAAFLASDHAAAISGTVANLTCGMSVD